RPGRRTSRGQEPPRRHLPSLPASIPAHHDDHDGRPPRCPALGPRDRRRLRAPPPPRHRHRRRPHREPGPHAVHDAGDLSRVRPARAAREDAPPGTGVNVSAPFIARPVATTLLTGGLALAGLVAFRLLPVSPLPQVEFPTISVSAGLPGASPETMATSVAAPLERQFGRIAGVTEMTSTSYLGATSIVLQFDLNRNIDGAARDVQAAINAARSYLPPDLPGKPSYRKDNPADAPLLILALTSDTLSKGQMYDAASTILQQKLSQVKGVGQVFVGGSSLPAVRVELNPAALNKYGIGLEDVRATLAATNVKRPKGQLGGGGWTWEIQTNDQLRRAAAQYTPLIVAYRAGAAVRLSDVASVQDSVEDLRAAGLVDGKPAVLLVVFRQPAANIIETVDRVRGLVPQLAAVIPAAIRLSVVLDRTTTIRASLRDVELTLLVSVLLVILVVFAFLRSVRATLIASVAVPMSLIGTFGVMYLLGYSLDNLSLMALTISTGFVVDDAIVMIENISRYIEEGEAPLKAALKGAQQIGFTILSLTVSLIAVLIPLLFMGDIVGRLFREFAMTLAGAILVSAVVALTLTPMMCAKLLKRPEERKEGRFGRAAERAFNRVVTAYMGSLRRILAHQPAVLVVAGVTLLVTLALYVFIPKGLFPVQDTGVILGISEAPQNVSFPAMAERQQALARVILKDPAVSGLSSFIGIDGTNVTLNSGRILINLKALAERDGVTEVIDRLRAALAEVAGIALYLQPVQDLTVEDRVSRTQFQYSLEDADEKELRLWAPRLVARLREQPALRDVASDQQDAGLEAMVSIDRATASRLGITPQMVDDALYNAFGQRQ